MRGRMSLFAWLKLVSSALTVVAVCVLAVGVSTALPRVDGPKIGTERNWKEAPAIAEVDTPEDVYDLGDVHGDYEHLVTLLTAAKLIAGKPDRPEDVRWTGKKAVLVNTGDMIDKGTHSIEVLTCLRALQVDAAKAGGRVILTMGNHEAEFLIDPNNTKAKNFIAELTTLDIKPSDVAAGKDKFGLGKFINALPVGARVNDWFFAHAGDTQGLTLKQLASTIEKEVRAKGYSVGVLLADDGMLEARLNVQPWWEDPKQPGTGEKRLRSYLEALGVKHLVIGHAPSTIRFEDGKTRHKGTSFQKFDGLIFLNDVGMSEGVNYSHGALLHIQTSKKGRVKVIYPDKETEVLWPGS